MTVQKISLSFSKYGDPGFQTKAGFILTSMTDNPNFLTPVPTLETVAEAIGKFSEDLIAAAGRGRSNVAEKNKSRQELTALLVQLGMYVMLTANGDAAVLISSGYSLNKMPEPRYISNPGNVTLSNGVSAGELVDSVKKDKNVIIYSHEITDQLPNDTTVWTRVQSTRCKYVFTGLIPGKQYWVRVAAMGSGEQIAYSTIATKFVQ
jgi:hypothetical protein